MAYRATERSMTDVIADMERRLRRVEQPGCCPPDPNWVLADVNGELRFIYSHSGALGPVIGIRSGTLNYDSDSEVTQQITQIISGGATPVGPAGGVLSGTYPNPDFAVDMATQAELDAHITDATDAHDASAISVVPAGSIASTNAQAALAELDGDIQGHITDATDAHDASAISVVPVGTIASTDVQAALAELDGDIQGHITDATDAHDASAISFVPSGTIVATDVQNAIQELDTTIAVAALDAAYEMSFLLMGG